MRRDLNEEAFELLADPLSSSTRTTKRYLYLFSGLCLIFSYTGVIPDSPRLLGFKLPDLSGVMLLWGLVGLTAFNLVSFLAALIPDYIRYRLTMDAFALQKARIVDDSIHTGPYDEQERDHYEQEFCSMTGYRAYQASEKLTLGITRFRFALDFIVPLLFAAWGIVSFVLSQS